MNGKIYREIPTAFLRGRASSRGRDGDPSVDGLCENIRQVGMVHPLTVRYCGYAAALRIGLDRVPCIVTDAEGGEDLLLSLSENIQRKNLSFFEEAEGMRRVLDLLGLTQEQLAEKLGKSQSAVANKLRLLQLSPPLRETLVAAGLTERHARTLLSVEGEGLPVWELPLWVPPEEAEKLSPAARTLTSSEVILLPIASETTHRK